MSKMITSVRSERNGSTYAVEMSGMSCRSDSWIDWKPRIDDPSNSCPTVKKSSSTVEAGMLKCCWLPGRSVKRMSRNLTSVSVMNFNTSDESVNRGFDIGEYSRGVERVRCGCNRLEARGAGFPDRDRVVSGMLRRPA